MSDITPRVDIVFKKIFGVEESKDLLISLINSIVSKEDQVHDLTMPQKLDKPELKKAISIFECYAL